MTTILAALSTVAVGLMSGLYWAFSVAVMPGLRDADDRAFVTTMQAINRRILNPWFLTVFMGSLLLPIAGGIVNSLDAPELLLPTLGAVLAGAVAGDHASPISDTTILSSTGAGCNVITHVTTQLPYVVLAVVAAVAGYVALALTGSTALGALVTALAGGLLILGARSAFPPLDPPGRGHPSGPPEGAEDVPTLQA